MALNYVVLKDVPNAKISAQSIESEGFEALKNDLLGDIYLLEGNTNEARKAYAAALIFYEGRNDLSQVIQTKIDALDDSYCAMSLPSFLTTKPTSMGRSIAFATWL